MSDSKRKLLDGVRKEAHSISDQVDATCIAAVEAYGSDKFESHMQSAQWWLAKHNARMKMQKRVVELIHAHWPKDEAQA